MRDESENEPTPAGETRDNEPTISRLAKVDTDDLFAAIDALDEPSEKISNINTISEAELAGNRGAEPISKNDPDETQPIQFEDELQTTPLKRDPITQIHEPTESQRDDLQAAFSDENKKENRGIPDSVTTDYKPAKS